MSGQPTQRVPVVWLTNEGGHDYTDAQRYGRLMQLTAGSINIFSPDRLMVLISERLRVADAEDYVVISGAPMLNALVLAMWLRRFPHIKCLLWSQKYGRYEQKTVTAGAVEKNALSEGLTT